MRNFLLTAVLAAASLFGGALIMSLASTLSKVVAPGAVTATPTSAARHTVSDDPSATRIGRRVARRARAWASRSRAAGVSGRYRRMGPPGSDRTSRPGLIERRRQ